MPKKMKMKFKKGPPPKKMARGGVLKADPKKGAINEGLVNPLEKAHGKTNGLIGGLRGARKRLPGWARDAFPDI